MALLGSVFLCVEPDVVYAAGTPCSITPVFTEANLNTCIAEAPTDNSEFTITLGASFNITTQKNITAGKNIALTSTNPSSPAILTRDPAFVGRLFSLSIAAPNVAAITIDSIIIDGGNQAAAANSQLIYTYGTGDVTVNLLGNTVLRNNNTTSNGGAIMIGSTNNKLNIAGNTQIASNQSSYGGGVYSMGIFTMSGGTISDNTVTGAGGGVVVAAGSTFDMSGGEISDNKTSGGAGGGVYVSNPPATFNMTGGKISGNTAGNGGGVNVHGDTFNMSGGEISGNTASDRGGGVRIVGTFNMTGGKISDNTANADGGGIWVERDNLANLTVSASAVFSGNSASVATRMNPADQALYDAQILATGFSLPLPFNGYNNFDISYESDLPTDICQHNTSLWADDTKCVSVPGTGLFGGQIGGVMMSAISVTASAVAIVVVFATRKLLAKHR